jgi:hypothetical protein
VREQVYGLRGLLECARMGNPQGAMYQKAVSRGLDPTTSAEFAASQGYLLEALEGLFAIAEDPRLPEDLLEKIAACFMKITAIRANNIVFLDRVGPAVDEQEGSSSGTSKA